MSPSTAVPIASLPEIYEASCGRGGAFTVIDHAGERTTRSYADLLEQAHKRAAGLAARGLEPGDRVALFARTDLDFIGGCLTVWCASGVVVPLPFPPRFFSRSAWRDQADARVRRTEPRFVLLGGDENVLSVDVEALSLTELDQGGSDAPSLPEVDDVALIQFTSGSTSDPRGVVLTHRTLATQFELFRQAIGAGRDHGYMVSWLPLYHDLGMVANVLMTMAMGTSATLMPPENFVRDPGSWLIEISRSRATSSAAPAFAYALAARAIERGLPEPIDLSSWDRAGAGGEAVNMKPLERFFKAAAPHGFDRSVFSAGYGLAEATCVTTLVPPSEEMTVDRVERASLLEGVAEQAGSAQGVVEFVSVGRPLPNVEVRITDDAGDELPERQVGEICVSGPTLMSGYYQDEAATTDVIRDGWLWTGDLGYKADGELFITGRAKELVIVRGQNFIPVDLETVVEEVPGTNWGCSIAIGVRTDDGEGLVIAAETKKEDPDEIAELAAAIKKKVYAETGVGAKEVLLLPRYSLPRTTSGKLQRGLFKKRYEAGDYQR